MRGKKEGRLPVRHQLLSVTVGMKRATTYVTATRTKHRRSIKIRNSSEIDSHSGRRLLHVGLCIILYVTPTPKLLWSLCCPRALCCHATIAKRSQSRDKGMRAQLAEPPLGDERAGAYCLLVGRHPI